MKYWVLLAVLPTTAAVAQTCAGVNEIALHVDPEAKVRPFETVVVQVRAYGKAQDKRVRLQCGGAKATVVQANGGWISKAFRFQGKDDEPFYQDSGSRIAQIFGSLTQSYVLQDAFLYHAPETTGKYEVEASLQNQTVRVSIEVTTSAAQRKPNEKSTFPAENRGQDPYRKVAEYWAPMLAQETWFQPKADIPTRFDYDGDWQGDNNWDDLDTGTSQAYVYYAAMETASHWFLIYNAFHTRDYSDKCVVGTCHENDNEGLILTVRKDGSEFGKLEVMETLAHNNIYSFVTDRRMRNGVHDVDGDIEFYKDSHPVVFVESGGHGIYGSKGANSKYQFAADKFLNGTGMTFVFKGVAERPRHGNDRLVGYELLPIATHWWAKAVEGATSDRTFDEYYVYQPFGNRPAGDGRKIGGTFLGRKESSNKAKPFWGWHDNTTRNKKVLNTGQWGLDPAYSVSRDLTFPSGETPSLEYTFNPYLNVVVNPQ